jgi:hypothetical protein
LRSFVARSSARLALSRSAIRTYVEAELAKTLAADAG